MVKIRTWVAGNKQLLYGFTLLELLVVLVIATLLLSIVTPRITAVIPGTELKTSTQRLAAVLRHARSQAIASVEVVEVALDPIKHQLTMTGTRKIYHWPESVYIGRQSSTDMPVPDAPSEGPITVRFFPDGSSEESELLLTSDAGKYSISVQWLTGKVTIDE